MLLGDRCAPTSSTTTPTRASSPPRSASVTSCSPSRTSTAASTSRPARPRPTRSRPSSTRAPTSPHWPRPTPRTTPPAAAPPRAACSVGRPQDGCLSAQDLSQLVAALRPGRPELPVNQVSDPVQTQFGYHLIEVTSRAVAPYDQAKSSVSSQVFLAYLQEGAGGAGCDQGRSAVRVGRETQRQQRQRAHHRPARPGPVFAGSTTTTVAPGRDRVASSPWPGRVVVIGLGPGDPALLSAGRPAAIDRVPDRYRAHGPPPLGASGAGRRAASTPIYDDGGHAGRGVPGHRGRAGRRRRPGRRGPVRRARLAARRRAHRRAAARPTAGSSVEIIPALSFLDLAWARLGVDPLAAGVRLVDGHRFARRGGRASRARCWWPSATPSWSCPRSSWPCRRQRPAGHRAAAPGTARRGGRRRRVGGPRPGHRARPPDLPVDPAAGGARRPRSWSASPSWCGPCAQRCPWDRAQTHRSLTRHLLEETYEVGRGHRRPRRPTAKAAEHLEEELGDLLFQVVLPRHHGRGGRAVHPRRRGPRRPRQAGAPPPPRVRRRPGADTPAQVMSNWEEIKQRGEGPHQRDGRHPRPPAVAALRPQGRSARRPRSGFDWDDVAGAWPKIAEEAAELQAAMDAVEPAAPSATSWATCCSPCVNVARHLDIDPEAALRAAAAKFRRRFEAVEALGRGAGPRPATPTWPPSTACGTRSRRRPEGPRSSCVARRRADSPKRATVKYLLPQQPTGVTARP